MATVLFNVMLSDWNGDGKKMTPKISSASVIQILDECDNLLVRFKQTPDAVSSLFDVSIFKGTDSAQLGTDCVVITNEGKSLVLRFGNGVEDVRTFTKLVNEFKYGRQASAFAVRTDEASASQYFQFYGYLSQQQNMMQDFIRTSTYQKAILSNVDDFRDKVVLDVGAGSGILSFFAVQSGARKVYAVEASSMAKHAERLVYSNKLDGKIKIIAGKIEEISIPEKVDVIISEPMGYMLFNERMLETYLHAKKWLAPGGKMFPSQGDLHIAPFGDAALYSEQLNKANFWYQENFHGVDLSVLRSAAVKEYFRQPIVDTFDIRICMAKSHRYIVDFLSSSEDDLHRIRIPFSFSILSSGEVHGLAFWFDVAFLGSNQTVWLSTCPTQPLTHWYQVRCLVDNPLFVHRGQSISGTVILISNKRQSYDVDIELSVDESGARASNSLDLKNPYFRYTGQAPQAPPGSHEVSPSEQYWNTVDASSNHNNTPCVPSSGTMNGSGNGGHHHSNGSAILEQQQQQMQLMQQQQQAQAALSSNRSSPMSVVGTRGTANATGAFVPPSSIGGGISPSLFTAANQSQTNNMTMLNSANFPISSNLMIGDYVTPGNILVPAQNFMYKQTSQQ